MNNFKMKELMIRIQPESSDQLNYAARVLNEGLPAEHNFGKCASPSNCGTPSTCSSAQSCNPSRCPNRPKPKPKRSESEFTGDVMELAALKDMLASMKIKIGNASQLVEMR